MTTVLVSSAALGFGVRSQGNASILGSYCDTVEQGGPQLLICAEKFVVTQ